METVTPVGRPGNIGLFELEMLFGLGPVSIRAAHRGEASMCRYSGEICRYRRGAAKIEANLYRW
ncbi:hypothetical protein HPP92_020727 [Vanilla planifolia]|uniref:Uncharacterized protein n=1 Tax=Vanilla planifolia TaxID=51239 RepID=A0A835PY73_VANPL|nr:hypothetical protein HPP92_021097 [Vanilla planifolia]KAG0462251.1 hypothetical protein HPP92_020727 [Vanilla planifolia]